MKKVLLLTLVVLSTSLYSKSQIKQYVLLNANPASQVLYTNYDNIIEVAGSGFNEIKLIGNGVTLKKINENKYSARVSTGTTKSTSIAVSGVTLAKKTVSYGTVVYQVRPLPTPVLYLDNSDPKSMIGRDGVHDLQVKMPVDLPFTAEVTNWNVMLENGASFTGTGSDLSAAANAAIASAPARSSMTVNVTYTVTENGSVSTKNISGVYYVE
jgi:hypothetical protein